MSEDSTHVLTGLLLAWRGGDEAARDRLFELTYQELHQLARRSMAREGPGHILQPTALLNEAYLRLIEVQKVNWKDRAHFLAMAACMMRRILVEDARARQTQKRGGDQSRISLEDAILVSGQSSRELVALDDSLTALEAVDERKSRVVELRFFGGLTREETAEVLGISLDTVKRGWKMAKVWLLREITRDRRG